LRHWNKPVCVWIGTFFFYLKEHEKMVEFCTTSIGYRRTSLISVPQKPQSPKSAKIKDVFSSFFFLCIVEKH